eukprot:TRINITY_DN1523_c1_g1_i1.p1 TRINITY_DN1523_c1_g1~~TRINITY_DN1523_c1_g1_i1.p1  ORF type:complete len:1033 (-),score=77.86 TRINITY_DN1523_c1_g1_i1:211-3018(-)
MSGSGKTSLAHRICAAELHRHPDTAVYWHELDGLSKLSFEDLYCGFVAAVASGDADSHFDSAKSQFDAYLQKHKVLLVVDNIVGHLSVPEENDRVGVILSKSKSSLNRLVTDAAEAAHNLSLMMKQFINLSVVLTSQQKLVSLAHVSVRVNGLPLPELRDFLSQKRIKSLDLSESSLKQILTLSKGLPKLALVLARTLEYRHCNSISDLCEIEGISLGDQISAAELYDVVLKAIAEVSAGVSMNDTLANVSCFATGSRVPFYLAGEAVVKKDGSLASPTVASAFLQQLADVEFVSIDSDKRFLEMHDSVWFWLKHKTPEPPEKFRRDLLALLKQAIYPAPYDWPDYRCTEYICDNLHHHVPVERHDDWFLLDGETPLLGKLRRSLCLAANLAISAFEDPEALAWLCFLRPSWRNWNNHRWANSLIMLLQQSTKSLSVAYVEGSDTCTLERSELRFRSVAAAKRAFNCFRLSQEMEKLHSLYWIAVPQLGIQQNSPSYRSLALPPKDFDYFVSLLVQISREREEPMVARVWPEGILKLLIANPLLESGGKHVPTVSNFSQEPEEPMIAIVCPQDIPELILANPPKCWRKRMPTVPQLQLHVLTHGPLFGIGFDAGCSVVRFEFGADLWPSVWPDVVVVVPPLLIPGRIHRCHITLLGPQSLISPLIDCVFAAAGIAEVDITTSPECHVFGSLDSSARNLCATLTTLTIRSGFGPHSGCLSQFYNLVAMSLDLDYSQSAASSHTIGPLCFPALKDLKLTSPRHPLDDLSFSARDEFIQAVLDGALHLWSLVLNVPACPLSAVSSSQALSTLTKLHIAQAPPYVVSLLQRTPRLRDLALVKCEIQQRAFNSSTYDELVQVQLRSLPLCNLASVKLARTKMSVETASGVINQLANMTQLNHLAIDWQYMGDTPAVRLLQFWQNCVSLETLGLDSDGEGL